MMLVELSNAAPRDPAQKHVNISTEQRRAEDLLDENRLYRQTALQEGDAALASVLDELERVLLDVAHSPEEVTPAQLERALQHRLDDHPLGEMLVEEGVLSSGNLQTALAYKMGYPLVDLTRFPIDRSAVSKLPLRMALESRAVPLMVDGTQLIVAVDRPSRADKLRALHVFAALTIVPVLASKNQIMLALMDLSRQKTWSEPIPPHLSFLVSTY